MKMFYPEFLNALDKVTRTWRKNKTLWVKWGKSKKTEGKEMQYSFFLIIFSHLIEITFSLKLALQNWQNLEMIRRW